MSPVRLLLGVLAVWRVTHLFHREDGPSDVFVRLRLLAGNGFWGKLLDCFYCLSIWVAAPVALLISRDWKERILLVPSLSAGAILVQRWVETPAKPPAAVYQEDAEE